MKRTFLAMLLGVLTLGLSAQTRGTDLGASFHVGGENEALVGLGVKLRHTLNAPIRLEANANMLFADHLTVQDFNANVHRLFSLNQRTTIYPLAGLNVSLWDWDLYGASGGSDTHVGLNLGCGVEYRFAPRWSVGFEAKYLFIKKEHAPFGSIGIAYRL